MLHVILALVLFELLAQGADVRAKGIEIQGQKPLVVVFNLGWIDLDNKARDQQ